MARAVSVSGNRSSDSVRSNGGLPFVLNVSVRLTPSVRAGAAGQMATVSWVPSIVKLSAEQGDGVAAPPGRAAVRTTSAAMARCRSPSRARFAAAAGAQEGA